MKSLMKMNFIVIFLHLLSTALIFVTKVSNCVQQNTNISNVNFQQSSSSASANTYVNAFLILSLVMISLQLIATIIGLPIEKRLVNWQMLFQMLGLIGYSWYTIMELPYRVISYLWGVFCLIPFLMDVIGRVTSSIRYRKFNATDS